MQLTQSAIDMAPPFATVSRYFFFALFCMIVSFAILLMADSSLALLDFRVAGAAHLYVLGFVMSVIIGALYQLTPVILETPFYSLKGSKLLFVIFALGLICLSFGMIASVSLLMHIGAGLLYLSLVVFSLLFLLSFLRVKRWSIVTLFLLSAGVWLLIGVSLGFILLLEMNGAGFGLDVISLVVRHGAVSLGGFVFFIVLGVSLVLLPMFALSHGVSTIYSKIAFVLMNIALIAGLFENFQILISLLGAGLLLYLLQSFLILKNRLRKKREYWFYHLSFAFLALFAAIISGFVGFLYGIDVLYKFALWLVLVGFGFHFIVGHLYKILPFLIWYEFISPLVGKQKVPMLHEMIKEKGAYLQLVLSSLGTILYGIGLILGTKALFIFGSIFLFLASLVLFYVVYEIYKFKNLGEK